MRSSSLLHIIRRNSIHRHVTAHVPQFVCSALASFLNTPDQEGDEKNGGDGHNDQSDDSFTNGVTQRIVIHIFWNKNIYYLLKNILVMQQFSECEFVYTEHKTRSLFPVFTGLVSLSRFHWLNVTHAQFKQLRPRFGSKM